LNLGACRDEFRGRQLHLVYPLLLCNLELCDVANEQVPATQWQSLHRWEPETVNVHSSSACLQFQ
jgi:hypothetical protein